MKLTLAWNPLSSLKNSLNSFSISTWMATVFMLSLALAPTLASAKVKTELVEYKDGDTVMEGFLAYDDAFKGPRPGVLVAHAWLGLTSFEQDRAVDLAKMGYVALATDVYGKGVRAKNYQEAGELAGKAKSDRALLRKRIMAGLETLKQNKLVDKSRIAAIGYCFGGTTVLELARAGAEIQGVVSLHGGLETPNVADGKNIKTRVLVLHGGIDPYVKDPELMNFMNEMREAKVDWEIITYGGAMHAFTDPQYKDPAMGALYDAKTAARSWVHLKGFLDDVLKK